MLKLELALLAPAVPSCLSHLRSKWQTWAVPSSWGHMDKVTGAWQRLVVCWQPLSSKHLSVLLSFLSPHPFSGHSQQQPKFLGPQHPLMANRRNFLFSAILVFSLCETPPGFVHPIMDRSFLTNIPWTPLYGFLKKFHFLLNYFRYLYLPSCFSPFFGSIYESSNYCGYGC